MAKELAEIRAFQRSILNEEPLPLNDELPFSTPHPHASVSRADATVSEERTSEQQLEEEAIANKGAIVTYKRVGRKRKPARALKSLFLPNDVRGTDYERFMRSSGRG